MIAERLREIAAEPYKATAALKLGALYKDLPEEDRDTIDLALAEGRAYSAAKTAGKILERIEEERMRAVGVCITKAQKEVLASAWEAHGDFPFSDQTAPELLLAALDLYNRGLLLRAESNEGRRYRLTAEGLVIARVLCAP